MTPFLVFNELSALPLAQDNAVAKGYLDSLFAALLDQRIPAGNVFVGPRHFLQIPICAGYSIGRWLSEHGDRDNRLRLRLLLDDKRRDYGECIPVDTAEAELVDYKLDGDTTVGLSTALLADGLAFSVTRDPWDITTVLIEKSWIDGNDVQTCGLSIPHAARPEHIDSHADWLRRVRTPAPVNGEQLWTQKQSLFPSLDFCAAAEAQIRSLGGDGPPLHAAIRGLRDLDNYCQGWTAGGFNIKAISSSSGESQSTLDMYSDQRTFTCPDGQSRVFSWHKKLGALRIHFFDFPAQKRLLVGYVGRHLDTAKHKYA